MRGVFKNASSWRKENMKYELIKYKSGDIEIEVNVSSQENTVWLSKEQMAILFDRDRTVISRHIKNLYAKEELIDESMCAENAHKTTKSNVHFLHITNSDKPVSFYNLEVILFVGKRTKSKELKPFVYWAKEVLENYNNSQKESNIIIFNDKNLSLNVKIMPEENTVYLTRDQMVMLFGRSKSVISRHINNIFKEGELEENQTVAKNATTGLDGKICVPCFFDTCLAQRRYLYNGQI